MTSAALQTGQRQQHTVTPRLQHAVRLLQLSSLDFAQEVHDAMGKNPFLEVEEAAARRHAARGRRRTRRGATPKAGRCRPTARADGDAPYERDSWQQSSAAAHQERRDATSARSTWSPPTSACASTCTARSTCCRCRRATTRSPAPIIESLDDDGYLRTDLEELARAQRSRPAGRRCEMQIALKLVQSLDPCGIGARNVSRVPAAAARLHRGRRRTRARARASSPSTSTGSPSTTSTRSRRRSPARRPTIEAVCDASATSIRGRAGASAPRDVHFVTPDVIVRKVRGNWTAHAEPGGRAAGAPEPASTPSCSSEHRDAKHTRARRASAGGALDGAQRASSASRPSCRSPRRS